MYVRSSDAMAAHDTHDAAAIRARAHVRMSAYVCAHVRRSGRMGGGTTRAVREQSRESSYACIYSTGGVDGGHCYCESS